MNLLLWILQIVLALVLLIGAGLMLRSFQHLTAEGDRLAVRGGVTGQCVASTASGVRGSLAPRCLSDSGYSR